jgi:hypothetical protein
MISEHLESLDMEGEGVHYGPEYVPGDYLTCLSITNHRLAEIRLLQLLQKRPIGC